MTFRVSPQAEPFGQPSAAEPSGNSSEMFRFGYRIPGTHTVLAAIEIPLSVVLQSIPQEMSVGLSQNGAVVARINIDQLGECCGIKEVSLVQLVEELIEPHRLSLEEFKASDLEVLLRTLEGSIQLVKTAISTLRSSEQPPRG